MPDSSGVSDLSVFYLHIEVTDARDKIGFASSRIFRQNKNIALVSGLMSVARSLRSDAVAPCRTTIIYHQSLIFSLCALYFREEITGLEY